MCIVYSHNCGLSLRCNRTRLQKALILVAKAAASGGLSIAAEASLAAWRRQFPATRHSKTRPGHACTHARLLRCTAMVMALAKNLRGRAYQHAGYRNDDKHNSHLTAAVVFSAQVPLMGMAEQHGPATHQWSLGRGWWVTCHACRHGCCCAHASVPPPRAQHKPFQMCSGARHTPSPSTRRCRSRAAILPLGRAATNVKNTHAVC